ncbi:MAG: hypothetical protein P4M15_12045 [Alphaproteobacteria bacterium]|nr:hypothetical protein [Alphaproteobacteria bacterium]
MKKDQKLSSGIYIKQDFSDAVRFVFYQTNDTAYPYATHGGTAFLINYRRRIYGLTCHHVFGAFEHHQLVITDAKRPLRGARVAKITGIFELSAASSDTSETDILDVCIIEFSEDTGSSFFKESAYVIDINTVATSEKGHKLIVSGVLNSKSYIADPAIEPGYCRLEFMDNGRQTSDPTTRQAIAEYHTPTFDSIDGISGAPVYDETSNALCGMVVRGSMNQTKCTINYIDIYDIIKALDAAHNGKPKASYQKTVDRIKR